MNVNRIGVLAAIIVLPIGGDSLYSADYFRLDAKTSRAARATSPSTPLPCRSNLPRIDGQRTTRNPPALVDRAYGRSFFWDGRAATLEGQVLQPIQNRKELFLSLDELERRMRASEGYRQGSERASLGATESCSTKGALPLHATTPTAGLLKFRLCASVHEMQWG